MQERTPRRSHGDGTSSFVAPRRATPAQQRIENACQPDLEILCAGGLTVREGIRFKGKNRLSEFDPLARAWLVADCNCDPGQSVVYRTTVGTAADRTPASR